MSENTPTTTPYTVPDNPADPEAAALLMSNNREHEQAAPTTGAASPPSIVNWECAPDGMVRAICQYCDRRSDPVEAAYDGRPRSWDLEPGWSCGPYPVDFEHADGSQGALFRCPSCCVLAGDRQRRGIRPLLSPTPARALNIATTVLGL